MPSSDQRQSLLPLRYLSNVAFFGSGRKMPPKTVAPAISLLSLSLSRSSARLPAAAYPLPSRPSPGPESVSPVPESVSPVQSTSGHTTSRTAIIYSESDVHIHFGPFRNLLLDIVKVLKAAD